MARYKLVSWLPDDGGSEGGAYEVGGQRKSTKAEVERWIEDNVKALGLDWRVGYMIKFREGSDIYQWRWIKDDLPLKK